MSSIWSHRQKTEALTSSESAYTVLGGLEIFWAELVTAQLYSSEEVWCVKGDGMRNQVLFPVIIHPVMCITLLLKCDHRKLLIYTPQTPTIIVTQTTGFSSPHCLSYALWYSIITTVYGVCELQLMIQAVILINKVLAAGKDHSNKAKSYHLANLLMIFNASVLIIFLDVLKG